MKRQLKFDFEKGQYVLKENNAVIFAIDGKELKFISLDFYNGIYKNQSTAIELINIIDKDEFKKGSYIFEWLTGIITSIQSSLNDLETDDCLDSHFSVKPSRVVSLFEQAACAGSGFYSEGPSNASQEIVSPYPEADYAVTISGKSMEPTILDRSIVFVKAVNELQNGDIGIFVVDGDVMCKRFIEESGKKLLKPDNESTEFSPIVLQDDTTCLVQGKVLF